MSTIKPTDERLLVQCARETGALLTAEDHNVIGGLGGVVAEAMARTVPVPIERVAARRAIARKAATAR